MASGPLHSIEYSFWITATGCTACARQLSGTQARKTRSNHLAFITQSLIVPHILNALGIDTADKALYARFQTPQLGLVDPPNIQRDYYPSSAFSGRRIDVESELGGHNSSVANALQSLTEDLLHMKP